MHQGNAAASRARSDSARHSERVASLVVRMLVGIVAFSWAAVVFSLVRQNSPPDPYWPAYLIGGGLFGAAVTLGTRGAGGRPLGRLLAALGYISICCIVAIYLSQPNKKWAVAITLLSIPLWLFLSSRSGRHGRPKPDQYRNVLE